MKHYEKVKNMNDAPSDTRDYFAKNNEFYRYS